MLSAGRWMAATVLVDLCGLALRAGDRVLVEVDVEFVLGERVRAARGGAVQAGEHSDSALFELLADFDVAVGGVADDPCRAPRLGLLVDERAGVVAVVLVAGGD